MRIGILYFSAGGAFYMACSLLAASGNQADIDTAVSSQWDANCAAAIAYSDSQTSFAYNAKP